MDERRLVMVFAATALVAGAASADTLNVPGSFPTIQAAINFADPGDEVVVAAGTYVTTLNMLGKAITLRSSDGAAVTIIDANSQGSAIRCISGEGNATVIDGFTFFDGFAPFGGGMRNDNSSPTVMNCVFRSCTATTDGGGMYNSDASPVVTNCVFDGNLASDDGGGMNNSDDSSPAVTGCTFIDNDCGGDGGGVRNSGLLANGIFDTCDFLTNDSLTDGGGMYNRGGASPTIMGCNFFENHATDGGGMHNDDARPLVFDCTFMGNTAEDGAGMHNQDDARPIVDTCMFIMNDAVDDGGGMRNEAGSTTTVIGCTFDQNEAGSGGAISNSSGMPLISGCLFTANVADIDAGGIRNSGDDSMALILDCTFQGNIASIDGGAVLNRAGTVAIISQCLFDSNEALDDGGAMQTQDDSSPLIAGCTFINNISNSEGGAMRNTELATPTIINSVFIGNDATLTGGAIHNQDSDPIIRNCSMSLNDAISGGGIRSIGASSPALYNCILWGNLNGQIVGVATAEYCDVQGGFPGTGNQNSDPMFVDPMTDLRLMPASPCIDAGSNSLANSCYGDRDGNDRFFDDVAVVDTGVGTAPIVDLGAYERGSSPIVDCNGNGLADACEVIDLDCNSNGQPDDCDLAGMTSDDCNGNGVPDECDAADLDCNGNAQPDDCDITSGIAPDCNANGVPDSCDIASATSTDCDVNGIPDDCEPDCDQNGVIDTCEIDGGVSDCDMNGVPDNCEADCNLNGVNDVCDISGGSSTDTDGDGLPDECEIPANDNCGSATLLVGNGTTPFATYGATGGGFDEADCDGVDASSIDADIWYRILNDECDGEMSISVCDSTFDTKIAVYGSACPTGAGEVIACSDDYCDGNAAVSFIASPGSFYRVRVGGASGAIGEGNLEVMCGPLPPLCPTDIDNNGATDVDDLVTVIIAWGSSGNAADVDGSGIVDVDDLVAVILAWGPC